ICQDLTETQAARYAALRDSFLSATDERREGLRAAMRGPRPRFEGDRDAMRGHIDSLEQVGKSLKSDQKDFEKSLRTILSSPQIKAYEARKKERAARSEDERRREREERFGEGPPGGRGA